MQWFRLYHETIYDRKLRRLPVTQRWLWVAVLTMASQSPERGKLLLAEGEPVTIHDLADAAEVPLSEVESGLEVFTRYGMVAQEDGIWVVINWDERQKRSDSSAPRVAAHREREKQNRNVTGNVSVTPQIQIQSKSNNTYAPPTNLTPLPTQEPTITPEAASAVPASVKRPASKPKPKTAASEKKTSPNRGQNEQWDALVDVLYQPTTTAERSNFGMVARDLREAGATGDEIRRRAANHRAMLESGVIPWELTTPNALLKHWTELAEIRQPRASPKREWVNGRAPQTPSNAPHRLVTAKDADPFKSLPDSA